MKWILGIDPGKSGALAYISEDGSQYQTYNLKDLTERDIFELIEEDADSVKKAYIEKVSSMPRDGVKSAWTFSGSYHGLRMALIACKIPFEEVRPLTWQSKMKCQTRGDKNITKKRSQELFPNIKITHANADSLLIAEYARRYS